MSTDTHQPDDIAVVGLGLRFPGNATSPEDLWDVLRRKESQWSEFPKDRLDIDGYYHPSGRRQGGISFRGAHFLKENVAAFDAAFFSIPSEEAAAIDPQQRMLLEVSYEALENAGIRKEDVDGGDCAVYVGSFVKDYEQICLRDPDWSPQYAATGNGIAIMANRISYALNLHGPSMTIDTGCSGSLIAVHLAAQTLRTGESSLAIAAGAGMILSPNTIMPMTALNFLSPDGKCFTFDSRANGYGRGEGIGAVIMKRLSDALRDNDTIHAVIRSSSTNQDGKTTGITLPSKEAQVANIRNAYAVAGLEFNQTAYVECHGTGTQAGDWRELKAISETIAAGRPADQHVVVGSIKPNIGHLEGAAGIAGLIKGILTLEYGKIPAQINFEKGNPNIDFDGWGVKVPTDMLDWPLPGIRRISVNCFGFGGSNAHVILDDASGYLSVRGLKGNHASIEQVSERYDAQITANKPDIPHLLCYSANDKTGVARVMSSHIKVLKSVSASSARDFLRNYAYTLGSRRSNLDWKGFIVANSVASVRSQIEQFDPKAVFRSSSGKKPKLGFIFCGQGSQWARMGQDLMIYNAFSESLHAASKYINNVLASPFDILQEIFRDPAISRIANPEIAQPATTALQIALIDLLASLGILPSHVVGHSSGEIAAAYAAGALSRESAWKVAYYRGLAAASIPIRAPKLRGGMIVVGMSVEKAVQYLTMAATAASLACVNSPRSVTISGMEDSIQWIANDLRMRNIFCKVLDVKTAYHSSHMKLVEYDYKDSLGLLSTDYTRDDVKMFSSVTGRLTQGIELDNEYWARNLVSPVQYVAAIESLLNLPHSEQPDILLEVSPGATLRSPTVDILANRKAVSPAYYSVLERKKAGPESFLNLVGELWTRGCAIDMDKLLTQGSDNVRLKCLPGLPSYPWNHSKQYWFETHLSRANRFRKYPRQDLIGSRTADSISFEPRWRGFLRISENPWIQDHQVQKTIVYPAAGMVSMVLEGAVQMASESKSPADLLGYELSDLVIEKAMLIPNTAHGLEVALNFRMDSSQNADSGGGALSSQSFSIYSKPLDRPWERHATGTLRFHHKIGDWEARFRLHETDRRAIEENCTETLVPRQLYETLDSIGLNYGSSFQNLIEVRKCNNASISKIRIPDTKCKMPEKFEYPHLIHPVALDAMFHSLLAIEPVPMVPVAIKSLFVSANAEAKAGLIFTGHSTTIVAGIRGAEANIVMKQDAAEHAYVIVEGLCLTRLSTTSPGTQGFLANHRNLATQIVWKEDATFASPMSYRDQVDILAHKYPSLAVLQVGAELSLTLATLSVLAPTNTDTPRLARYTIVAPDDHDVALNAKRFAKGTLIESLVEIVTDLSNIKATYNLILVGSHYRDNPERLKKLLGSGGILLRQTVSNLFSGDFRKNHTYKLSASNATASGLEVTLEAWRNQPAPTSPVRSDVMFLISPEKSVEVSEFLAAVKRFEQAGRLPFRFIATIFPENIRAHPGLLQGKIIVSLLDFLGTQSQDHSVFDWNQADFACFHALQSHAKAILWITRGAHMTSRNPKGSPIIALARTLMSEDPLKTIITLDLGADSKLQEQSVVQNVLSVFKTSFGIHPGTGPRELEYAEESGKLYIPRLTTISTLNRMIEDDAFANRSERAFDQSSDEARGLQLALSQVNTSEGSFCFTEFEPKEVQDDEVEIVFIEAPLSFLDVETVLGRTSDTAIGLDIRGKVKRVGKAVSHLAPGDEVMALVPDGVIRNTLNVKARFAKRICSDFVPSFFISAYYALFHIGRLIRGRKVLIHAGASAFGLAAIELALAVKAEVFATVLGADTFQQRDILKKRGISLDHIFDAEDGCLVGALRATTNAKGVDVVYNPTLKRIDADLKVVRRSGSIIQFSDKSLAHQASRITLSTSIAIANFDLRQLLEDDPEFAGEMFDQAFQLLGSNPIETSSLKKHFDVHNLNDILLHIQQAPFVGFASVVSNSDSKSTVSVLNSGNSKPLNKCLDSQGTYLLSGGLGGLGKSISELLVQNGVRHLAYLSRSGVSSEAGRSFIAGLQARGVDARAYAVDICDAAALESTIQDTLQNEMPPIRGVFQCAAVIRDAVFDNMTFDDWDAAIRPKTVGSWNLVHAIKAAGHDPFFIFLSSSAGVIGNRGQANYASGNCFQDSLARHLQLQGKHAVSVDLGPVLGAGMLAENEVLLDILRASGFYGIRHGDFLKVMECAIRGEVLPGVPLPAQVILGVGTGGIIDQNQPADPYWSRTALYSFLNLVDRVPADLSQANDASSSSSSSMDIKSMLRHVADMDAATSIVCAGLSSMLAKSMNLLPEEIDVNRPPSNYGVDSLVAVSVRNWVLGSCGVQISVFEILGDATIAETSRCIAEKSEAGRLIDA